jgi:phosphoribosylformimino-5-aminoimidazole carboxamide ribonucleotide (ProFAR) isomerase
MAFEVIPAIDVAGGRLVRLTADGTARVEVFDGDPLAAARGFVEAGARRLHVVDVDLALTGEPRNVDVLRAVAALGVPVQASGGIVTEALVDAALEAGASRVVLGSAALADRPGVEALVAGRGNALVVAIEADGPTIRPRGRGVAEAPLWDTLQWLAGLDVHRFLFTEVGRAGSLAGPDLDGIWAIATHTGRPVVASGGVRNLDDLRAIAGLGRPVEGAVVGRAFYEGLDHRAALRAFG